MFENLSYGNLPSPGDLLVLDRNFYYAFDAYPPAPRVVVRYFLCYLEKLILASVRLDRRLHVETDGHVSAAIEHSSPQLRD